MPVAALGGAGPAGTGTGFYGKLPGRGDFVQRRLPAAVVAPWDEWLRAGMAASRAQLGGAWNDLYMTFPVWRFALSPGLCGADALIGVLLPSVDSVSRPFPLTLAAPVGGLPAASAAEAGAAWFAAAEPLALEALGDDFDLEPWDARLAALDGPPAGSDATFSPGATGLPLRLSVASGTQPQGAYSRMLDALLRAAAPLYSLWWTDGSSTVEPVVAAIPGLPAPADFATLLFSRAQGAGRDGPCPTPER
jgi:type VI secretion system protein ImpM